MDFIMSENEEDNIKPKIEIIVPKKKEIESVQYRTPKQAYKIFRDIIDYEDYELKGQEHSWVMGIDSTGFISCIYIAALGSENCIVVDPIDVFGLAISKGARLIILAHNHPNTNTKPTPSSADLDLTNQFYHACKTFSLTIIDHIIIADGCYYSFLESGDMELIQQSIKYKAYNHIKHELDQEKKEHGQHCRELGLIEGKKNKAFDIAISLLKSNVDIDIIAASTGLPKKWLEEMQKKI